MTTLKPVLHRWRNALIFPLSLVVLLTSASLSCGQEQKPPGQDGGKSAAKPGEKPASAAPAAGAPAAKADAAKPDAAKPDAGEKPAGPPAGAPQGPPPAMVRVGLADQRTLQDRWDIVGRVQEVRRAIVASEQSGRVIEMPVDEGDVVVKGKTTLARIDDVWVKLELESAQARAAEAQAAIAEAQARLDKTTSDRANLESLQAANAARPREVEDARSLEAANRARVDQGRAALQSAQAAIATARTNLERLVVKAPFDGMVVKKMTEVGQWLTPGSPVAEIISSGPIDAIVDVPERLINNVSEGASIDVIIEAMKMETAGKVVAINPMGASAARTFPVKIRLDNAQGRLKPGMSVVAAVPTSQKIDAITVPRDAIQRSDLGAVVWANLGGSAVPLNVQVLFGSQDRYVVRGTGSGPPLAPGTQVVIEGAERLFPGRPLMVVPTMPPPATPAAAPAGAGASAAAGG